MMPTGEQVVVAADADDATRLGAERIAVALATAVGERGRADWATTGGSVAPAIYRHLSAIPLRDVVPWADVHVWWGDDRYVPRDHPLSNVKPLDDILLDPDHGVRIPTEQLHPFRTTESIGSGWDAAWTANALANDLGVAELETVDGWPVLDLIVVGIGGDGHLLSVFPGSRAFDSAAWALAVPAPTHIEPHVERVTLNPALLGVAREVLAVATGDGKAEILADVFETSPAPRRLPAQLARRAGATWILDPAAASGLPR